MTNTLKIVPIPEESPVSYADRIGEWYASLTSDDHKSEHGQFLTPTAIAAFMGSLAISSSAKFAPGSTVRILDPGAGSGVLSCAICEALATSEAPPGRVELTVYEVESGLLKHLRSTLEYLTIWLSERTPAVELSFALLSFDFVLDNAFCITSEQIRISFTEKQHSHCQYDFVISNPPYFKIAKEDPRAKACKSVVHGQPNIYSLFMAVGAHMLKLGGELIYITPRSFCSGPYFRLFREKFFAEMRPVQIHLFGSRTDAFDRSEVLQENVILHAVRDSNWANTAKANTERVMVSFSAGASDIAVHSSRVVPVCEVIDLKTLNRFVHIPTSDEEQRIIHLVNSWSGTLNGYGLEISTGPVVPFRATQFITNDDGTSTGLNVVPLLWMQNVKPMMTTWPVTTRKQQYIIANDESEYLTLPNKNYVVMRRFSPKEDFRRITASPYIAANYTQYEQVGLENHLNYIYCKKGGDLTTVEAYGICALLSCHLLDIYFRSYNGNTQVSATELRCMPFPDMKTILDIGKEAASGIKTNGELDQWITEMLMSSYIPSEG